MKKSFFLLSLIVLVLVASCKKESDIQPTPPDIEQNIHNLKVSQDFSWRTSKDIQITARSNQSGIVSVSGPDGQVYHKAFLSKTSPVIVKVTIPTSVSSLRIIQFGKVETAGLNTSNISVNFIH